MVKGKDLTPRYSALEGSSQEQVSGKVPVLPGRVTKDNFAEAAVAFMRASGKKEFPILSRDGGPFRAWIAFLKQLGCKMAFREKADRITMPTEWPWDFSVDADVLRDTYEVGA